MLSERQRLVLQSIVDDYIRTAEPVGSRSISKRKGVGYSAATIRNEMADLEELGYLEQPHTSAGHIPSHLGYRFYVDHLIPMIRPPRNDIKALRSLFALKMDELEQTIEQTATILSQITNYTTIILGPQVFGNRLKHLQVVPLSQQTAVSVIVTDTGHVEKRRIKVPAGISLHSIEKLVNLLNAKLVGVPLYKLKETVHEELQEELMRHVDQCEYVLDLVDQLVQADPNLRVHFSGTTNMLDQPEFRDLEKVKGLLSLFEQGNTVVQLFPLMEEGVQVRIGHENPLEEVSQCSIISATYTLKGRPLGTIGVLGPTRMNYKKVIGLLQILTKDFSEHLRRLYG